MCWHESESTTTMNEQMQLIPIDTDEEKVIELWITTKRSKHTQRAYHRHIERFKLFLCKSIVQVTLFDLQAYVEHMEEEGICKNSQKVVIDVIKSYLSFAYRAGFLRINVGAAFQALQKEETMSERILSEYEVESMMRAEKDVRNHAILRVLYGGGIRVSELCGLRWKDVVDRGKEQVQVSVLGKGNKRRYILLSEQSSKDILAIGRGKDGECVFRNEAYRTEKLTERSVQYIVKYAARNAGIARWEDVSPHWLRHSHATHAIERGAPVSLVRDTLGHSSIAVTDIYSHVRPGDSSSRFLSNF